MEYAKVYDLTYQTMNFFWLAPVLFLLLSTGYLWGLFKIAGSESRPSGHKSRRWFIPVALWITALYMTISIVPASIRNYTETRKIYYNQAYHVVEGKIENFVPMAAGGHGYESFSVAGVTFEYSDFDSTYHGFNNTSSHGGPIKTNGQQVRLAYITIDGRNIILKIEVRI
ncbi:MAG TPA: hypothetical protein PLL53_11990 [Saprospiraceae bacterium]|nr:hypothetical protein [Saprospiraceae bacterium]